MDNCSDLASLLRDDSVTSIEPVWPMIIESIGKRIDEISCTRHPLGFLHLELTPIARLDKNERLRLHYWPTRGSNADDAGSLHDHVWHLSSVVAAGRLKDRTLKPVPDPNGNYDGTRVNYSDHGNTFTDEGRFTLHFDREIEIAPNSVYRIPSRVVHDSTVADAPAVTFVLARDDEQASTLGPLLLQRPGANAPGTAVRERVDAASALALVSARIAAH